MASALNTDDDNTHLLLTRYINCAEYAVTKCQSLSHITGSQKLERKCLAELRYLKSLKMRKGGVDITNLRSSNLSHYLGVIRTAENVPGVTQILQAFDCPGRFEPLNVDVVAGQGHLWIKVVARKAQALHLIWAGAGQYGERDIVSQAEDFVLCTTGHPVNFTNPVVVYAFYNGVTKPLAGALHKLGVFVLGEEVNVSEAVGNELSHVDASQSDSDDDKINDIISGTLYESVHKSDLDEECLLIELDERARDTNLSKIDAHNVNTSLDEFVHVISEDINKITFEKQFTGIEMPITCPFSTILSDSEVYHTNRCVSQSLLNSDCTRTGGSIDLTVSQFHAKCDKQIVQYSRMNNTHVLESNLTEGSKDKLLQVNCQIEDLFQSQIENSINAQITLDLSETSVPDITCFIHTELIQHPVADYSSLDEIVSQTSQCSVDSIKKINLDITALITLVSSVSHGQCYYHFNDKILNEQAEEERRNPVLPNLEAFLKGKELVMCKTAEKGFKSILSALGGEAENERARALLARVTIVPDNPSFRAKRLPETGKIKTRSKIIFGTGDSLRVVTVTANSGFVRAAEHKGVQFAVFIHSSRALTERKEKSAEIITEEHL